MDFVEKSGGEFGVLPCFLLFKRFQPSSSGPTVPKSDDSSIICPSISAVGGHLGSRLSGNLGGRLGIEAHRQCGAWDSASEIHGYFVSEMLK